MDSFPIYGRHGGVYQMLTSTFGSYRPQERTMAQIQINDDLTARVGIHDGQLVFGFQQGRKFVGYPIPADKAREVARHLNSASDVVDRLEAAR